MPVVDGGLLSDGPGRRGGLGSAAGVPAADRHHPGRDEPSSPSGAPALASLDDDGLRRWMRRVTADPDERRGGHRRGADGPLGPGRAGDARGTCGWPSPPSSSSGCPRCGWPTPTPARPGPGWGPTPTCSRGSRRHLDGYLGSCHALEIPFVFGTVHNPAIQGFSGGGESALALSAAMRRAWTAFARTGSPGTLVPAGSPAAGRPVSSDRGPGADGLEHQVDRPRHEELEAWRRWCALPSPPERPGPGPRIRGSSRRCS